MFHPRFTANGVAGASNKKEVKMTNEVNASNYFEATAGVFKKLPGRVCNLFLNSVGEDVEWAGCTWSFNFRSARSFYWTDGTCLIRVSDHWSKGAVETQCGWIRRCWWELYSKSTSTKFGRVDKFYAGVSAFEDMKNL